MDEQKGFDSLLTSLRILGCIEPGEFVGTNSEKNIYCRYSSNWWNTLSDLIRLETWNCTHQSLKKIYCFGLPEYIKYSADNKYALEDLKRICQNALKGVSRLKDTYNIAYQTQSGGKYDEVFDTLINSYAKIHIKYIDDLISPKKSVGFLPIPILKRSVSIIDEEKTDCSDCNQS